MKTLLMIWLNIIIAYPTSPVDPTKDTNPDLLPTCIIDNNVYQPGEKMVFKIFYNWTALWLSAGEVIFRVEDQVIENIPVYHISAIGETYKSYEWVYKVKDKYETYIDKETLLPYKFARDAYEGGYIMKDEYNFDHSNNVVYTKNMKYDPVREGQFQISACAHDAVSAIYYSRCIDFDQYQEGDKIPLEVFIDGDTYNMYFRYLGKKKVRTKLGKFNTIKIQPLMLNNDYFDGGEHMAVYVTDDKNRVPVRIETPLTVGSIKADLIGYGGLKHPFTARIK